MIELDPVAIIHSPLKDRAEAPKQNTEGAPAAVVEVDPRFAEAVDSLRPGSRVVLLTWLHQADRTALRVHPRGNPDRPMRGVFNTRSPDRPNPIGLHEVTITAVEGMRLTVEPLEAIDGTPVLDIKIAT